jgi:hypothetical protein
MSLNIHFGTAGWNSIQSLGAVSRYEVLSITHGKGYYARRSISQHPTFRPRPVVPMMNKESRRLKELSLM